MTGQSNNNVWRALIDKLWPRLLLGFIVPLVLFLAAAIVALLAIQRLVGALEREQHTEEVLDKAFAMQKTVTAMAAAKRAHRLFGRDEFRAEFDKHRRNFAKLLDALHKQLDDDPEQFHRLVEIEELEKKWHAAGESTFKLSEKGPKVLDEFMRFAAQVSLEQSVASLQNAIDILIKSEFDRLRQRRDEVRAQSAESLWAIALAVAVSVGFSLVISWLLSSSVTWPINHLGHAVAEMRQGRFQAVTPFGPIEIADLMRGFNLMGIALAERNSLLESSELRYRTIVGTTSNILWTTDATGRNSDMTSWCAFTGQQACEIEGACWMNAVHPDDRDGFAQRWLAAVGSKAFAEDEVRIRRADGEYRHFNCRGVPIFDPTGNVLEWVRICIDITERMKEEQLRREKEAAEAANRAKSEFLAKMSHELRTPLNAVIGMSKMLNTQRFGALNEKQLDYLSDITHAGEHLLSLINDILDLSKVEVGRMELSIEPLMVGDTALQTVSTLRALAENKNLHLELQCPEPDGQIEADAARFKQVLFNLVSNAVKFTPSGGRVTVRCHWAAEAREAAPLVDKASATAIRIDVEDTGIGIDLADQDSIGAEFFQANRHAHKAKEGTGLGVALSRRLVELMGGSLWFTSELGKGSVFSFALPLHARMALQRRVPRTPSSVIAVRQDGMPLALVIEDHAPTNKLLSDWLTQAGLHTVSAYDGRSGLEQARTLKPQLILLDMHMPDCTGLEVLTQLRGDARTADSKVIIVSVMAEERRVRELDVADWLVKPLDRAHLLARLRAALPEPARPIASVLLVDDDPAFHNWLCDLLEIEGVHTLSARSGREALTVLERELPDLVLLDLLMPEMNGFQVVMTIRSRPDWQHIPILIVTGKDVSAEDARNFANAVQDILRKDTLTPEKLSERLRFLGIARGERTGAAGLQSAVSGIHFP